MSPYSDADPKLLSSNNIRSFPMSFSPVSIFHRAITGICMQLYYFITFVRIVVETTLWGVQLALESVSGRLVQEFTISYTSSQYHREFRVQYAQCEYSKCTCGKRKGAC